MRARGDQPRMSAAWNQCSSPLSAFNITMYTFALSQDRDGIPGNALDNFPASAIIGTVLGASEPGPRLRCQGEPAAPLQ